MTIIVQDPVAHLPVFAVETLPVSPVASTEDVTRLSDLLFEKRGHDAGYDNFQINVVPVNFKDDWALTNQSPEICNLNESGLATRLDDGGAVIYLDSGGHRQRIRLTFTSGQSTTYIWKGFTGTSVSSVMSNTMRDMADAGGDLCYFQNYTQGDTTVTVNPDRWFTPDLSACALVTDIFEVWSTANSGVKVADRVFLGVAHWDDQTATNLTPGRRIKFRNGTVRTILSRYKPPGYDLYVCILNENGSDDTPSMKIVGQWFEESLTSTESRLLGMGWQLHQDKRVTLCVFDSVMYGGSFPRSNATTGVVGFFTWLNLPKYFSDPVSWMYGYDNFFTEGIGGDSGGAIGTVVDGEAVLVSLFTGRQAGHLYYEGIENDMNSWIQSAAALAGVSISDTVTIADSPL